MSDFELPEIPKRDPEVHKSLVGRTLIIAGSMGMTGAGVLSSMAALRTGAGLVTWAVPSPLTTIAEIKCTEAITWPIPATDGGQASIEAREHLSEASHEADAVVLGPGMGVAGETGELMRLLIPEIHAPLLIDAGGLTALGINHKPLEKRKDATILTPHPGEMSRLCGRKVTEIEADREGCAKDFALKTGSIILLKGPKTIVTDGKKVYLNNTGNPGMATAGSGDVLAGIIVALISQGIPPFDSACLGSHLHGIAGDIAKDKFGEHGLIASDILNAIPAATLRYIQK
ncbi:MAG: NAD(P)H-hydrate dehydratase [Planctomycetota bacterium]|jgi:NAD(P)H-hydrate epimerase